jgi:hypothetical protein
MSDMDLEEVNGKKNEMTMTSLIFLLLIKEREEGGLGGEVGEGRKGVGRKDQENSAECNRKGRDRRIIIILWHLLHERLIHSPD